MTIDQFNTLGEGDVFEHGKKQYTVVGTQGSYVISQPVTDPVKRIHFLPRQAAEMIPSTPAQPREEKPKSSHGFPLLERAKSKLPAPHMASDTAPGQICVDIDLIAQPRPMSATLGPPVDGARERLYDMQELGFGILIASSPKHTRQDIYNWLLCHAPGLEKIPVTHEWPSDSFILSDRSIPCQPGHFPTIDEIHKMTESVDEI